MSRLFLALILASLAIVPLTQISPIPVQASISTFSATIVDNAYQPARIDVITGTQIIWTYASTGKVQHTVTSAPNTNTTQGGTPLISSGPLNPGQSFSYTFYKHGSYPIQCGFHPFMNELVNVTGSDVQPSSAPTVTSAIDYTPYIIGGIIAAAIVIVSAALFLQRRTQKAGALRRSGQREAKRKVESFLDRLFLQRHANLFTRLRRELEGSVLISSVNLDQLYHFVY